jgi:ferritin-like metal-binding protein YciE
MDTLHPNMLGTASLRSVFIYQLSILYSAKTHLTNNLPSFIERSTFNVLKLALAEDLADTKIQMDCIKTMFSMLNEASLTNSNLGMTTLIGEALSQVHYNKDNHFESDMSIIFYMNVIENMQIGASKMLTLIAKKPAYQHYAQLVAESRDISSDNASLFDCIADEYIRISLN